MAVEAGDQTARGASLHDIVVDRRLIRDLFARGLITTEARDHALDLIEPPRQWGLWAGRILLVVGLALVLAGTVNFFAFNWQAIPGLAKLAGIGTLVMLSGIGAALVGPKRVAGQALITVAVVLVGVFLAVFGQIYQTGADAWQLFAGWAALTLPWALLSTTAAAWAVWLAVANLGIHLWFQQSFGRASDLVGLETLALVTFDGAFLVAREVLVTARARWAYPRWTRIYLLLPVLGYAAFSLTGVIFDRGSRTPAGTASAAVAVVAILAALFVYRRMLPDIAALAAALCAGLFVAVVAIFRVISGDTSRDFFGAFLFTGIATIVLFALAAAWLRSSARAMAARGGNREVPHHG